MAAINTEQFRKNNANALLADIVSVNSAYYIGVGKSDDWYEDLPEYLTSPFPKGTRLDELQVLDALVTMIKVIPSDASVVIPRILAANSDVFKAYDPYDSGCFYPSDGKKPCYAIEGDRIYLCVHAPVATTNFQSGDSLPFDGFLSHGLQNIGGYIWAYIGTFNRFSPLSNTQFLPIESEDLAGSVTYATLELDPAGTNNEIIVTSKTSGVAGNDFSAEIIIDNTTNRQVLSAVEVTDLVTITSGDKRVMSVTADFGSGVQSYVLTTADNLLWTSDGLDSPSNDQVRLVTVEDATAILSLVTASDDPSFTVTTTEFVYYPDELDWSAPTLNFGATGIPTVVASPALASQAISAINGDIALPIVAATKATSNATGPIAAFTEANLANGSGSGSIVDIQNATGGLIHGLSVVHGGLGYTAGTTSLLFEGIGLNGVWKSETVAGFVVAVDGNGVITGIEMPVNTATWPSRFKNAVVTVSTTTATETSNVYAHIGPIGGFGFNPAATLPSWYVGVSGNTNLEITADVLAEYRQISLVRNPLDTTDAICTLQSLAAAKSFELPGFVPGLTEFVPGDIVYQDGQIIGVLVSHVLDDPDVPTGCTVYYNQTNGVSYFPINVFGQITVGAVDTATIPTLILDKYQKGTGKVLFIENRSPITQAPGQNEEIKLVIQL